jgi:hypothetical protein
MVEGSSFKRDSTGKGALIPMRTETDLVVVGAGAAGYAAPLLALVPGSGFPTTA